MRHVFTKMFCIGLAKIFMVLATAACEKESTAEKAGRKIDRVMESARKKLEETTK